jgi:hypothetical protein
MGDPVVGCIQTTDQAKGGIVYFDAPAKFLGDQSASYGKTLSYSIWHNLGQSPGGTAVYPYPAVKLIGSGGVTLIPVQDTLRPHDETWHPFSFSFTAGIWKFSSSELVATESEIQNILANLEGIEIVAEIGSGTDVIRLDNVVLGTSCPGGAGGDPHIKTWDAGENYDYHGHCDLVLLHSERFQNGKGLSIHIRSSPYKTIYSYISEAVVRIGTDILEVGNSGEHYINGSPQDIGATDALSGYAITSSVTKRGRYVYKIHVTDKEEIILREYRHWISISIQKGSAQDFGDCVGLMGSFNTGAWIGRDRTTQFTNANAFGQEWHVQNETDGQLFRTPSPYLDECELLTSQSLQVTRNLRQRRLEENSFSRQDVLEACSHWGDSFEDCVLDVQASGDLSMALEGPFF